jgi:ribosomal 50S subunit-associated protein YjgA (DUF615 family)
VSRFRRLRGEDPTVELIVDPKLEEAARELGLLEREGIERALCRGGGSEGRAPTAAIALPGHAWRLHLRPVRHGGWLGGLWGRRLMGLARPLGELEITDALRQRGAPVPRPALVSGHRVGRFWEAALGTRLEENSIDGARFLGQHPSRRRLLAAARAAGSAVRRLHDAGGRHRDLQIANLLVRETGAETEVVVVDLDRARMVPDLSASRRMTELMRLYRSLRKRLLLDAVGPRACAAFFGAYTAGDRRLRSQLLRHLPREQIRTAIHALAYPTTSPDRP